MNTSPNTRSVSDLFISFWGDTPAGRFLARASVRMLLFLAVWIGMQWVLSFTGSDYGTPSSFPWRSLLSFLLSAGFAVCLVWFGFQLAIGLHAEKSESMIWAHPILYICCLVAMIMAQNASLGLWVNLTQNDAPLLLVIAFRIGMVALIIALLWSLLPVAPLFFARLRTYNNNLRQKSVSQAVKSHVGEALHPENSPLFREAAHHPAPSPSPSTASAVRKEGKPGAKSFCPNCGAAIKAGTRFCGGCGAKIGG